MYMRPRKIVGVQPELPDPELVAEAAERKAMKQAAARKKRALTMAQKKENDLLTFNYGVIDGAIAAGHSRVLINHGEDGPCEAYMLDASEYLPNFRLLKLTRVPHSAQEFDAGDVWFVYAPRIDSRDNRDLVWSWTAMHGRTQIEMFMRADVPAPPNMYHSIITMAVRPINKIRFQGGPYFVPERQFIYGGHRYA